MLRVYAWPKISNRDSNPYQYLLYSEVDKMDYIDVREFSAKSLIGVLSADILHIHWPDVFLAANGKGKFWLKLFFLRVLFFILRIRRIPVVWTVHNLKRAEQRNYALLDYFFWPWFSKRVDGVIYMTQESKREAEKLYPRWRGIPNFIIPHGDYLNVIESVELENYSSEENLAIPGILFFGSITEYKNAYKVLRSFVDLPNGLSRLSIMGKVSDNNPDHELLYLLESDSVKSRDDIVFENRFLSDIELVSALNNHDLVVFPYSEVLNSGAAIFALSSGRPILASDIPVFRELQAQVGEDWVYLIKGELDSNTLLEALKRAERLRNKESKPDLSELSWKGIAEETINAYRVVLNDMPGGLL